jgi:hypothetical protein
VTLLQELQFHANASGPPLRGHGQPPSRKEIKKNWFSLLERDYGSLRKIFDHGWKETRIFLESFASSVFFSIRDQVLFPLQSREPKNLAALREKIPPDPVEPIFSKPESIQ